MDNEKIKILEGFQDDLEQLNRDCQEFLRMKMEALETKIYLHKKRLMKEQDEVLDEQAEAERVKNTLELVAELGKEVV